LASNVLGIDLDAGEMRLVELVPGGGGYTLHAALTLPAGAADAAALGAQLKDRMKEVGFKATSAVIALCHDAFTARVVRHPNIPEGELPAVVQFQVLKEVSLPADDTIVDYVPLKQLLATGERRSLTFVVRKGRVSFCEQLCEAAGIKLIAVVPSAIALTAELTKGRPEATGTAAFAAGNSFFVLSDGELVFNRSLAQPYDAADFFGELRRSIAGYENQPGMPALGALFIASNLMPANSEAYLAQSRVPAQLYDPYAGVQGTDRLAGHGDYAAALGAAQVTRAFRKAPVDFLNPKKVVVKPNNTRKYATWGAIAAGILIVTVAAGYWAITSTYDADISDLQAQITRKEPDKNLVAEVEKQFEMIDNWHRQQLYILEELYDLAATFPDMAGVQIVSAEWKRLPPAGSTPGAPAKPAPPAKPTGPAPRPVAARPVARMTIKATADQESSLRQLEEALRDSLHWKYVKTELVPQDSKSRVYELDIPAMTPAEYASVITPGKNVTASGNGQTTNTPRRPGVRRFGGRQ